MAHVQLAGGDALGRAVGKTVDHHPAHAADALATVMIEGHRLLAFVGQLLVQQVEHLQEGGIGADVVEMIVLEAPLVVGVGLAPNA